MRVLAGDVGGTNARLAVVDVDGGTATIEREERFPSRDYPGLAPIVKSFLPTQQERPERACFGVACPVVEQRCTAPNLPWTIDARSIAAEIETATSIINDFDAIGHGLRLLGSDDVVVLQEGKQDPKGQIALLGAGTGLGQGFLVWNGSRHLVCSSEGGHIDFAPRNQQEYRLHEYLADRYGRVSYERVLSGPGILDTYRFLVASGFAEERPEVAAEMQEEDPSAVITEHGLAGTDQLCVKTLDIFAGVFGAQAGNVALALVATGGVFLAGGIAPKILPKLRDGKFVAAFRDKGRLSNFLAKVAVNVITSPKVGLLGAAAAAAGE